LKQYKGYCKVLEELVMVTKKSQHDHDAIDLLTLLIATWDEAHNSFSDADPVEVLGFLMKEKNLKAVDLANELGVSKSLISDILHYRRGFSREVIRKLAVRFKVSQELFNKPYKLLSSPDANSGARNSDVRNSDVRSGVGRRKAKAQA
jgi:HTH-type transcriptional regulator/antitoxin HigA